ncbi:hypothetical protein BKA81DRAFT_359109 [Phyllosticta paracitricarpa]|uniref:Uncharacterized protein n=1 Tax=Phyllosticta paracitricarpa TaxID=2016321 RepID=A0ABR1MX91_9PEZI
MQSYRSADAFTAHPYPSCEAAEPPLRTLAPQRPPSTHSPSAPVIAHWQAQWHNGRLFIYDASSPGWLEIPTHNLRPQHFFNPTTYHEERSDVWLSKVQGNHYLYTMRDDHGVLAFKVEPQVARPPHHPPGPSVLGKRAITREAPTPPPAKKPKPSKANGPTRIRKDRRVHTPVYQDVWKRIFELSDPAMLFTYEKVSSEFLQALGYSHIWRHAMRHHFGPNLPPTPSGITDRQYADLLSGQGCMSCREPKARKTYWAFLRRWCTKCFGEKIIKQDDCFAYNQKFPGMLETIPCATVDSWNHYSYAGWGDDDGRSRTSGNQPVYLKEDLSTTSKSYADFVIDLGKRNLDADQVLEEQTEYIKERKAKLEALMDERYEIDKFEKKWIAMRAAKSSDLKTQRKEYIIRKAAQLDPPMTEDVLNLIPAYQDNIKINKEFKTEKFWKVLKTKLEEARPEAEKVVAMERRAAQMGFWDMLPEIQAMNSTYALRMINSFTDDCSKAVIDEAHKKEMGHQEFALRILNKVRAIAGETLNLPTQMPNESPFADVYPRNGKYVLTIEHACKVYEQRIGPLLSDIYSEFRPPTRNVQKFKCPGCKRNDVSKQRTFRQLMNHIREDHAVTIGDFQSFRLAGSKPEPYLIGVPWPRNLPALTDNQKSNGCWNADAEPEYGSESLPTPQNFGKVQSVFVRRGVCSVGSIENGVSNGPNDFLGNVKDALTVLEDTGLSAPVKSRLVVEYGDRLVKKANGESAVPEFHILRFDVDAWLMSSNNHDIFDKMCCGVCRKATDGKTRGGKNYAKMPSSRAEMIRHFVLHHQSDSCRWPRDMFALPSDDEVTLALQKGGQKAMDAFNKLFPELEEPFKTEMVPLQTLASVANQHKLNARPAKQTITQYRQQNPPTNYMSNNQPRPTIPAPQMMSDMFPSPHLDSRAVNAMERAQHHLPQVGGGLPPMAPAPHRPRPPPPSLQPIQPSSSHPHHPIAPGPSLLWYSQANLPHGYHSHHSMYRPYGG